jgi:hypothetical protein
MRDLRFRWQWRWRLPSSGGATPCRRTYIFERSRRPLKILDARRVTWREVHTEDPPILGATVQNLVSWVTRSPGLCTPGYKYTGVPDECHTAGNFPISNHATTASFHLISNSLSTYHPSTARVYTTPTDSIIKYRGVHKPGRQVPRAIRIFLGSA